MRILLLVGTILALALAPVQAQQARTLMVVDFPNISADSGLIPPAHLTQILQRALERQGGGGWRVVAGDAVRAAMRARGYRADEMVSPSKAAEIAQAVGADWVVTGLWTQLRIIGRGVPEGPGSPMPRTGDKFAYAAVDVRVLDAANRRTLLEDRFTGQASGGDLGALYIAAFDALRDAAARIVRL